MKRYDLKRNKFRATLLLMLVALLAGCYPDDFDRKNWGPEPILTLSIPNLTLQATGGSGDVNIETNYDEWKTQVKEGEEWCQVEKKAGIMRIIASENKRSTARKATIAVTVGQGKQILSREFSVFQLGASPVILLEPAALSFTMAGGSQRVEVTSNQDTWVAAVSMGKDWCHLETGDHFFMVKVDAYTGEEVREALITVRSGEDEEETTQTTLKVSQLGSAVVLELSENALSFSPLSEKRSLFITTNQPEWKVQLEQTSWCAYERKGNEIVVSVQENKAKESRKAEMTLVAGGMLRTILLVQSGTDPQLEISPEQLTFKASEGMQTVLVSTNMGTWTAETADEEWCSALPGNRNLTIAVTAYTNISVPRQTTVIVKSGQGNQIQTKSLQVIQLPDITLEVSRDTVNMDAQAGSSAVQIVTNQSAWKAEVAGDASWCSVSQSGNQLNVQTTANLTGYTRQTAVTVKAGEGIAEIRREIAIVQLGEFPDFAGMLVGTWYRIEGNRKSTYTFSTDKQAGIMEAENGQYAVYRGAYEVDGNVLTITGSEKNQTYTIESIANRTLILASESGDEVFTQIADPTVETDKQQVNLHEEGATENIAVTANTLWTVKGAPEWLALSQDGGEGKGTLVVTAGVNPTREVREATLILYTGLKYETVKVVQAANIPYVRLNVTKLEVPAEGKTETVSLSSNRQWKAGNLPDWIKVDPLVGERDQTLTVKILPNAEAKSRSVVISFTAEDAMAQLSIVQKAAESSLSLDHTSLQIGAEGGKSVVQVTSNKNWVVDKVPSAWMTVTPLIGNGDGSFTLDVKANVSTATREAILVVKTEDASVELTVVQEASSGILALDKSTFQEAASGAMEQLNLTCNVDWEITEVPDWVSFNTLKGKGDAFLRMTVQANMGETSRTTMIKVKAGSKVVTITIVQAAAQVYMVPLLLTGEAMGSGQSVSGKHLFAVQVMSRLRNSGETYAPYGYGLFDDSTAVKVKLSDVYEYRIEATLLIEGVAKIYHEGGYAAPVSTDVFAGAANEKSTELENTMILSGERGFTGIAKGYARLTDGKGYIHPDVFRYYGEISDWSPVSASAREIPLKSTVFGFACRVNNLPAGTIRVELEGAPVFRFGKTEEYKAERLFSLNNDSGQWLTEGYSESGTVKVILENIDGTTRTLLSQKVTFKRKVKTELTVNYEEGMFSFNWETEEMEDHDMGEFNGNVWW